MAGVVFEDLHAEYDSKTTVFPTTNESIKTWREGLKDVRVDKAAAICSGGEISFFAILPVVAKELDLIDHAYCSMYYAIGKHHLIEKLGSTKAHTLLTEKPKVGVPETKLNEVQAYFVEGNEGLRTGEVFSKNYRALWREFSMYCMRKVLADISKDDIKAFMRNRKKLRFLHGDLNDLVKRGPYDLVYLSNALDYAGRNGKNYPVKEMVKPGGLVCYTISGYRDSVYYGGPRHPRPVDGWKTVFHATHTGTMRWSYYIVKAPE